MKKSKRVKKSNSWRIKQHRDQFFKKSKTLGYRSRASFKLIELNKNIVDVTPEREVDNQTLIELKNTTSTLIMQVHEHKKDMESMLDSDEDFSI